MSRRGEDMEQASPPRRSLPSLPGMPRRWWPAAAPLLVVGAYALCAALSYWHVWANPGARSLAPDASDPAGATWFLAWTPFALLHLHNPFLSTWANAPYGVNVLGNTSELLLGLVAAPLTLGAGPVTSYNVLMASCGVVSASAMYVLARRFISWRPAAFGAGLLYGFSPYMVGQTAAGHLNLAFVPLPPLVFLVLHELLVRQRGRPWALGLTLAGLAVYNLLMSTV
ncbi:MAG: hypothetical protein ACREOE_14170, partial [Gemmatimonadales bacterium]